MKQRRLLGLFDGNHFISQANVSHFGNWDKKYSIYRRVITDFSVPLGQTVNDKTRKGTYPRKDP